MFAKALPCYASDSICAISHEDLNPAQAAAADGKPDIVRWRRCAWQAPLTIWAAVTETLSHVWDVALRFFDTPSKFHRRLTWAQHRWIYLGILESFDQQSLSQMFNVTSQLLYRTCVRRQRYTWQVNRQKRQLHVFELRTSLLLLPTDYIIPWIAIDLTQGWR